jgi:hypothetical protein
MKRINHNDLTHYFIRDHKTLPASYLKSCRQLFDSFDSNFRPQATSAKAQACKPQANKQAK